VHGIWCKGFKQNSLEMEKITHVNRIIIIH
jgi:hypothetical protein